MTAPTEPCWEGWGNHDHNPTGQCCCNCEYQLPITAHPWNEGWAKGSVNEIIGYGCVTPDLFPNITFFGKKHNMCECWHPRDYTKYTTDHLIEITRNDA